MWCSHVYHSACIVSWLQRTNTCPCCRAQMIETVCPPYNGTRQDKLVSDVTPKHAYYVELAQHVVQVNMYCKQTQKTPTLRFINNIYVYSYVCFYICNVYTQWPGMTEQALSFVTSRASPLTSTITPGTAAAEGIHKHTLTHTLTHTHTLIIY